MFGSEIRSFEKPPAMLNYSALALNQKGSDARGPLKYGRLGREPGVGQDVRHGSNEAGRGQEMRSAQSAGDRISRCVNDVS